MAEVVSPITRQITKGELDSQDPPVDIRLQKVEDCLVYDRRGVPLPFKKLYQDRKAVIVFVRVGETFRFIILGEHEDILKNLK